jgi:hypothetical protein
MSDNSSVLSCDSEHRCSGKGCGHHGRNQLRILYVGKSGYFCDHCTKEILDQGLAVKGDIK